MKLHLLTIIICCLSLSTFAEVITPDEALARVSLPSKQLLSTSSNTPPKLVKTETANNQPTLYIYSTQGNGYMILTADDKATPMLAYGLDLTGEVNPTMQWLIEEYSHEIQSLRKNYQPQTAHPTTITSKTPIAPLLTTKWNQLSPYNNMCPEINGNQCATGCVVTAMAQIINYHRLSTENAAKASYSWNGQTLAFDFANERFDWDNMVDVYNSSTTETQNQAVAKLMYACGVSVQMNYGTNISVASYLNVPNALIDYFGFDKSAHFEKRSFYRINEWNDFIYAQLSECGPLILRGTNDNGGHMFVCDGYSSEDFFHINWGWGGNGDGYFKLSALTPDNQGIGGSVGGYNANLSVLANTKAPEAESSYHQEMSLLSAMSTNKQIATLGENIIVSGEFTNTGASTISGYLGFIIEDTDTGKATTYSSKIINLAKTYGYKQLYLSIPSNLANGTYKIYPAWSTYDSDWQKMRSDVSIPNHIIMTIERPNAQFSMATGPHLEISNIDIPAPIFIGSNTTINCTVTNSSEQEFYGRISAVLLSDNDSTPIATGGNITVELGVTESKQIEYKSCFTALENQELTAGTYNLVFVDYESKIISSLTPVEVLTKPTENGSVKVTSLELIGDSKNADKNNLKFTATIVGTKGYFIGNIDLWIFEVTGYGYNQISYISSPTLYIQEGESVTHTFKGAMPSLENGKNYCAVAYYKSSTLSNITNFTVGDMSAIDNIVADNEIITREYYTISGINVAEENLKPGIYILVNRMRNSQVSTLKILIPDKL